MERLKLSIQYFADGKVVIDTDLNESGFKNGLDKMKSVASTGFKAVAGATGVAATAVVGLVTKSVQAAGELEQQIGGTEAVFGEFAETVQEKSKKAFSTMGVSANQYMQTANKMAALMQGSGISIEDSMNMSTEAMQRAADIASIMGIDVQSAMDAVTAAAKGNFTLMDNIGVKMDANTIEAYALSKGLDTTWASMDNATKIGLAMELFMERSAYAAGNYTKENETFAGSFNTLKAATNNFLSGAGGIEDLSDALIGFSKVLVKSIQEAAPRVLEGIVGLVDSIIPQIPPLIESILPTVIEGAVNLINGLTKILPEIVKILKEFAPQIVKGAISIVKTLVETILSMLPEILELGITVLIELAKGIAEALPDLIPTIIEVVMTMIAILIENLPLIIDAGFQLLIGLIEGIVNAIPKLIEMLPTIIEKIVSTLIQFTPQLLQASIQIIIALAKGLIQAIPQLVKSLPQIIAAIVNGLISGLGAIADIGVQFVKGIWNGISNSFTWIKDKIRGWVGNVLSFIKKLFGIHSPSTVMRDQVGKYLAQGMGVGFDNELDNVYDDMQKAIDLETSKMSANVQTSGTYQMAMAGTPQFTLQDNSENVTRLEVNGRVLAEVVNTENRNREVATA